MLLLLLLLLSLLLFYNFVLWMLIESKSKDQRTVVIMSVSVVFGVLLLVSISWLLIWKRTFHRSKGKYMNTSFILYVL